MYTYDMRVGFSHVNQNKEMRMEALLDALQDAPCFQGEELGVGFDVLEPMKCAWLLNYWQIDVKRFPVFNEKIRIGTFPTAFKSFMGTRNFVILDEVGNQMVMANSIWTFVDMEKMHPTKVSAKIIEAYTLEEPLPMEYASRKISIPQTEEWVMAEKESITICEYHLDSNNHVNNGQYFRIASAFFAGKKYNRLRVEYRRQAVLGDTIVPVLYEKEDTCVVLLCDKEKNPYAIVEVSITETENRG